MTLRLVGLLAGIGLLYVNRGQVALLVFYFNLYIELLKFCKSQILEYFMVFEGWNVTESHEHGIARVVMGLVEIQ